MSFVSGSVPMTVWIGSWRSTNQKARHHILKVHAVSVYITARIVNTNWNAYQMMNIFF